MKKLYLLILFIVLLTCGLISFFIIYTNQFNLEKVSHNLKKQIKDGDCLTYTNFYEREFKKLGINTQRVLISVKNYEEEGTLILEGHTFLIAYNSEGYCKLDQEDINCFVYENLYNHNSK